MLFLCHHSIAVDIFEIDIYTQLLRPSGYTIFNKDYSLKICQACVLLLASDDEMKRYLNYKNIIDKCS